jgi:hypothetical protein
VAEAAEPKAAAEPGAPAAEPAEPEAKPKRAPRKPAAKKPAPDATANGAPTPLERASERVREAVQADAPAGDEAA